jgi:hypothetical protein
MKLNVLETHDRLQYLKKDQAINISQGAEDCLRNNPLSLALQELSPYVYLFAHPRTCDDGVTKKMMWQPRLTKPKAQTNSYLFRAQSNSDLMEICWLLPPEEMWKQYKSGNVTQHELVRWSIEMYKNHKSELERAHEDDLHDEKIKFIYTQIAVKMDTDNRHSQLMERLYGSAESSQS